MLADSLSMNVVLWCIMWHDIQNTLK